MTHPRLSVSEVCTFSLSFADELDLWQELGIRNVGVIMGKLASYGFDRAANALQERSIRGNTVVITECFDLGAPESWGATRARINEAVDFASVIGGFVYFTTGRSDGRTFDELTDSLADAVAPCVAYASSKAVRLAIEPTLMRTERSYVHTLRDALDVADATGLDIIADLGNCWTDRDYEATIRGAGRHLAGVQFADAVVGTLEAPAPGGRAVPGDGDLHIDRFIQATLDAGYTGLFELELLGPLIKAEGYVAALRRGVERATRLLEDVLS